MTPSDADWIEESIVKTYGDGDNSFPSEMFQADIAPLLAPLLERNNALETALRECGAMLVNIRTIVAEDGKTVMAQKCTEQIARIDAILKATAEKSATA